jgi:protein-S-isoprenylcysteine O-methyltransferase Ste14
MNQVEQQAGGNETSGPIARPPLLFLAALLIGVILDRLAPFPFPGTGASRWLIGGSMILIGLVLGGAGMRNFALAGTPVRSIKPTRTLVTTGVHRWTRNPIYAGMLLVYGGIGVAAGGLWILIMALPLMMVIRYGVVAREELYLERRFGDGYLNYKSRVRRWL